MRIRGWISIHDLVAESLELDPLEWLGEVVSKHLFRGAICDRDFVVSNPVSHEKISDVDVSGPLAARSLAVLFQKNGALVILVHDGVAYCIPLCLQKIAGPYDLRHDIACRHELCLGRAFRRQLLPG